MTGEGDLDEDDGPGHDEERRPVDKRPDTIGAAATGHGVADECDEARQDEFDDIEL